MVWYSLVLVPAIYLMCQGTIEAETLVFSRDVLPIFDQHCSECHGKDQQKGGLDLSRSFPFAQSRQSHETLIISGDPEQSELIKRVEHADPDVRMPRDQTPLSNTELKILKQWIREGAVWPDDGWRPAVHWSFVAPVKPSLPEVSNQTWSQTPIDRFILRRLEDRNLSPSIPVGRAELLRRLSLDLLGLPPSVNALDAFLSDSRPNAFEHAVDRFLASPAFGEKWARHWLDLARYADSEGYQRDELREIWAYRDWVIHALNRDLPFREFTIEQLAGDLLPEPRFDQLVATGFHRNTPVNLEAGTDPKADYHKQIIDRVGTTGSVWLGLTVGCAQCHDHKYDPISIKDYYQFFAFFNRAPVETRQAGQAMGSSNMIYIGPDMDVVSDGDVERRRAHWAQLHAQAVMSLRNYVDPLWSESSLDVVPKEKQTAAVKAAFKRIPSKRQLEDYRQFLALILEGDQHARVLMQEADHTVRMRDAYPKAVTRIMKDSEFRPTHVLKRGDLENRGERVGPATPAGLHPFSDEFSRDRLGLAKWLVSNENPLIARVTVNRIWAELFGRGLVATLDDFGRQGEIPSHPQLLDWLAETFVHDDHWSLKRFIRRIVRSAVYQQAAAERDSALQIDADNQFLWRYPGHRLSAESIRDQLLSLAGMLSLKMGGPPAYPWQPETVWRSSAGAGPMSYPVDRGEDGFRRGIYTVWRRSAHYPSFAVFDAPDRGSCVVSRGRSNTPLQALTLMNDGVYVDAARAFANRIESRDSGGIDQALVWAFRSAVARYPSDDERALLKRIYREEFQLSGDASEGWFNVATVLMNLHETVCRN